MKDAIAIAIAKARKRAGTIYPDPRQTLNIDEEISRAGLGILLITGALVGLGGIFCLMGGIFHSGGVIGFIKGWLTALNFY